MPASAGIAERLRYRFLENVVEKTDGGNGELISKYKELERQGKAGQKNLEELERELEQYE